MRLGPIEYKDSEKYREWRNDERIKTWCRQVHLRSRADQTAWIDKIQKDSSIEMFSIDLINSRAEFSLYIGPEYQGAGFGQSALKLLLRKAFEDMNLNLIWGETFDGNPAARMFEKVGFIKEGTRRDFYYKKGKYIDAHLYSIKREEFKH